MGAPCVWEPEHEAHGPPWSLRLPKVRARLLTEHVRNHLLEARFAFPEIGIGRIPKALDPPNPPPSSRHYGFGKLAGGVLWPLRSWPQQTA
jgi:hypothetical protein